MSKECDYWHLSGTFCSVLWTHLWECCKDEAVVSCSFLKPCLIRRMLYRYLYHLSCYVIADLTLIFFPLKCIIQLRKNFNHPRMLHSLWYKDAGYVFFRPYSFLRLEKYFIFSYSQHFCDSLHKNLRSLTFCFRLNNIFTNIDLERM